LVLAAPDQTLLETAQTAAHQVLIPCLRWVAVVLVVVATPLASLVGPAVVDRVPALALSAVPARLVREMLAGVVAMAV
jgi:hypothetical protein